MLYVPNIILYNFHISMNDVNCPVYGVFCPRTLYNIFGVSQTPQHSISCVFGQQCKLSQLEYYIVCPLFVILQYVSYICFLSQQYHSSHRPKNTIFQPQDLVPNNHSLSMIWGLISPRNIICPKNIVMCPYDILWQNMRWSLWHHDSWFYKCLSHLFMVPKISSHCCKNIIFLP